MSVENLKYHSTHVKIPSVIHMSASVGIGETASSIHVILCCKPFLLSLSRGSHESRNSSVDAGLLCDKTAEVSVELKQWPCAFRYVHGQLRGVRPTALAELMLLLERIQTSLSRWIQLLMAQWPCTAYHCYINTNVTTPRSTSNSSTLNINITLKPGMHKSRMPHRPGEYSFLPCRLISVRFSKNIATCHHSGTQNFEMVFIFTKTKKARTRV